MSKKDKAGFVSLIGAGPGDPGLITVRGVERLAQADVVVYDRLANPLLLRMAPGASWIPVGKEPGYHPVPQEEINAILVENALNGNRVVRLKGGDPFVFGRGGEEALALKSAGICFEVVPGVTSAIAAPAYAGIPVTHRKIAGSVAFITGHRARDVKDPDATWLMDCLAADTLVFLMGVKNLPKIVDLLLTRDRPADTPAALIERGTSPRQKTICGDLSNIVEKSTEIRPPAVCIIGDVVKLRDQLRWFDDQDTHPLFGLRILNTKSLPPEVGNGDVHQKILADNFDEQVTLLGAETIHLPILQILPTPGVDPLQAAARAVAVGDKFTWVIFTSVNGVHFFFETLSALGYDSRCLNTVKIAAIGPATARGLHNRGIRPDFMPAKFLGAELGRQIPINPGERILLPRSEIAMPELPQILKERGGIVEEVNAYAVGYAPPDPVILKQLVAGSIDVITFFSPSGVTGFIQMLEKSGYPPPYDSILASTTVACIGPTTAKAAREANILVDVIPEEYTSNGLVQALVKWQKHS